MARLEAKPPELHGRIQGETNLWACMRSKPSSREKRQRRTEPDTWRWRVEAEQPSGGGGDWTQAGETAEGRSLENHTRGSSGDPGEANPTALAVSDSGANEPLRPNRAFEGDGKERGSRRRETARGARTGKAPKTQRTA